MVAISCDKVAIKFIDEFCDYTTSRKVALVYIRQPTSIP